MDASFFFVLYFSPLFLSLTRRKGNFRDRQGGELVSSPLFGHVYIYRERETLGGEGEKRRETGTTPGVKGFLPISLYFIINIYCV